MPQWLRWLACAVGRHRFTQLPRLTEGRLVIPCDGCETESEGIVVASPEQLEQARRQKELRTAGRAPLRPTVRRENTDANR